MTTVLLSELLQAQAEEIKKIFTDETVVVKRENEDVSPMIDVRIAIGGNDRNRVRRLIASAPSLVWYHSFSVGVEEIVDEFVGREITLTNNRGAYTIPIAEHVMMFLLAASQQLHLYVDQRRRREWKVQRRGTLRGANLLIFGMGAIGCEIGRLGENAGMRVTGIRRNASSSEWPHILPLDQLIKAVGDADYFVISAPLTPATRGAITKDVLGRMKRSAWLINIARGAIVDERALIDALLRNQIAGAALDVFEYEPLPRESPLWTLDNVIITPHTAANSDRVFERSLSLLRENAERFRAGMQLRNVVRLDQGY